MLSFLKAFFGLSQRPDPAVAARVLNLESSIRSLEMDITEKDKTLQLLKNELERAESKKESTIDSAVSSQLEGLIADIAPAVAQIATQEYLLKVEAKPIQGKDVLTVAMSLLHSLEDKGMKLEGTIGAQVPFDPNKHDLLGMGDSSLINDGSSVTVRMPAVTYQGRILKKMAVLAAPMAGT